MDFGKESGDCGDLLDSPDSRLPVSSLEVHHLFECNSSICNLARRSRTWLIACFSTLKDFKSQDSRDCSLHSSVVTLLARNSQHSVLEETSQSRVLYWHCWHCWHFGSRQTERNGESRVRASGEGGANADPQMQQQKQQARVATR